MTNTSIKNKLLLALLGFGLPLVSMQVWAQGAVKDEYKWLSFAVFGAIIGLTMYVTYVAASRVKNANDFYTAGGGISGVQNGWAIAGDYLSAASFLGIAGLISIWGYDGFMYSVGWLVAYISVLLVMAEPCRNIGKYTLPDILAYRNDPKKVRIVGALSVVTVSTFYLTAQMVGGGMLIRALIGIEYEIAVIAVGALVIVYVLLGGMVAATWVQVIKAGLLVLISFFMVLLVWSQYGLFGDFLSTLVGDANIQARVATLLGDAAGQLTPQELGRRFLAPGLLYQNPLDQISLALALVFGAAGLPHILTRFFTVPGVAAVRYSLLWAMLVIAGFYVLAFFLGMGAAIQVGGAAIVQLDPGGNMALPLLAQSLAGGPRSLAGNLFLALVAAVAFVMIVAVMAGLVLAAASAIGHDLYAVLWRRGRASGAVAMAAGRWATLLVGLVAIVLGISAKGHNVAALVALAFALAASTNFPAILLTLHWRLTTTAGVVGGMLIGGSTALLLIVVSPAMDYPQQIKAEARQVLAGEAARRQSISQGLANADRGVQERARQDALLLDRALRQAKLDLERYRDQEASLVGLYAPAIDLRNPGLWSIPAGFLAAVVISLLTVDPRSRERWNELQVRKNIGAL